MLVIKSFDPHKVVLVDEDNKEHVLIAEGADEFDQNLVETIIGSRVSLQS